MASVSAQYRMADRLAGGRLNEILIEHRRAGDSYDHTGRVLFADFGIVAARNTIEAWTNRAEAAEPDAKAAM